MGEGLEWSPVLGVAVGLDLALLVRPTVTYSGLGGGSRWACPAQTGGFGTGGAGGTLGDAGPTSTWLNWSSSQHESPVWPVSNNLYKTRYLYLKQREQKFTFHIPLTKSAALNRLLNCSQASANAVTGIFRGSLFPPVFEDRGLFCAFWFGI